MFREGKKQLVTWILPAAMVMAFVVIPKIIKHSK